MLGKGLKVRTYTYVGRGGLRTSHTVAVVGDWEFRNKEKYKKLPERHYCTVCQYPRMICYDTVCGYKIEKISEREVDIEVLRKCPYKLEFSIFECGVANAGRFCSAYEFCKNIPPSIRILLREILFVKGGKE